MADTDDKNDPSCKYFILRTIISTVSHTLLDRVAIFLILSAATEVAAIVCASLPVLGPEAFKEYKRRRAAPSYDYGSQSHSRNRLSKGFDQLYGSGSRTASDHGQHQPIALSSVGINEHSRAIGAGKIWVESEVKITVDDGCQETNQSNTQGGDAVMTGATTHA